jgi:LIVCS family branched-chain amino acid:cation transporter
MFSMFFGAGNVVFPLALGRSAGAYTASACAGLVLTAIIIPFMGLFSLILFNGDYERYFKRLGNSAGAILIFLIMLLIGPAGAMPRLITLSHATVKLNLFDVSLIPFSLIACALVFALTVKQTRLVDIIGYYLTPVLLASLGLIIVRGLWVHPPLVAEHGNALKMFGMGLLEGYNTMDLMGAFFFSHVILLCLREELPADIVADKPRFMRFTAAACGLGAGLLGIVYAGFCVVAAYYSAELQGVPDDQLLGTVASMVLGGSGGIVASMGVYFSCLTTAIALASVFAEYVAKELSGERLGYPVALALTLIVTLLISTLEFDGIARFLIPVLQLMYPALIVLAALNLAHKLWGVKMVKAPVAVTFAATVLHWACS